MVSDQGRGFAFGVAAYVLWGAFPLYFPLLEPAGALEILGHRVVWSVLTLLVLLTLMRRTPYLLAIWREPRKRWFLSVAALVIAVNWGTYIFAVNSGKVVEGSLGYFINPIVTVLMGVLVLGERLRPWQWVAMGIALVAVIGLTVEYGRPPWIALTLAFSFGTYGLVKKQAGAGAIESLTFETLALAPIALGFLVWLAATGRSHFTSEGPGHVALMVSLGVVTAVPLLCFGAAAISVPMTTLGLLQYLAPILQFLIGITIVGEHMSPMRWLGFALVWLALAILTTEALQHRRRHLRFTSAPPAG